MMIAFLFSLAVGGGPGHPAMSRSDWPNATKPVRQAAIPGVCLLVAQTVAFQGSSKDVSRGETGMKDRATRALLGKFATTWNAKDVPALGALFAEDADFVDIAGNLANGRREIERLHQFPFSTGLKAAKISEESLTIRDLGGGIVSGDLRWKNVGAIGRDGQPAPPQFGNLFFIARVDGDVASFVSARNTNYTGDLGRPGR